MLNELYRRGFHILLVVALCGGSCTPWKPPPRTPMPPGPPPPVWSGPVDEHTLRDVIVKVCQARQLEEKWPIVVEQYAQEDYQETLRRQLEKPAEQLSSSKDVDDMLLGLNLRPPPDKRQNIASARSVLQEQVAAYYVRASDTIVLSVAAYEHKKARNRRLAMFAHEVQHALQQRNFDLPAIPADASYDHRLARRALIEGDAMLAMGAYLGARHDKPLGRILLRMHKALKNVDPAQLHRRSHRHLSRALPLMRESLSFPYNQGLDFVIDLYRAGGFPLLNKAYEVPPTSSAHILHAQRYIDGIQPAVFAPLPALEGLTVTRQMRVGELVTRVTMSRCNKRSVADKAAAGWLGDRMTMATLPDGAAAVVWQTFWDSEEDASEAQRALSNGGCWRANSEKKLTLKKSVWVKRRKRQVLVLRGMNETQANAWQQPLLAQTPTLPQPKPVSFAKVPRRIHQPYPEWGRVIDNRFHYERLGIIAELPADVEADTTNNTIPLILRRDYKPLVLLWLSEKLVSPAVNEQLFEKIRWILGKNYIARHLEPVASAPIKTPLGMSETVTWANDNMRVRVMLIPMCEGTGSLVIVLLYRDSDDEMELNRWVQNIHQSDDYPPVCHHLNPQ